MRYFYNYPLDDSLCTSTCKRFAPPPFKLVITQLCFLRLGNTGIIQPDATEIYGESCLHTAACDLQNRKSITTAKRYWLACPEQEVKVVFLLNKLRAKRRMYPVKLRDCFTLPYETL